MLHAKGTLEREKKDIMAKKTGLEEELRVKQEILMETTVCVCVCLSVCVHASMHACVRRFVQANERFSNNVTQAAA